MAKAKTKKAETPKEVKAPKVEKRPSTVEEVKAPKVVKKAVTPKKVEAPKKVEDTRMITLESALESKPLEVSVNKETWKGKTITVPAKYEGEVRRLLSDGGYIVRN